MSTLNGQPLLRLACWEAHRGPVSGWPDEKLQQVIFKFCKLLLENPVEKNVPNDFNLCKLFLLAKGDFMSSHAALAPSP